MIIRAQQMNELAASYEQSFHRQLVRELYSFAPWHAQILHDDGLLACVRYAVDRAERYGFTNRGPIRLYLQMIFMLGSEFDSDPTLLWAAEILNHRGITDQQVRATRLYEQLTDYLEHVAGPENKFAKDALKRASDHLEAGLPADGNDLERTITEMLGDLHPEKC